MKNVLKFIASILFSLGAGVLGSFFTASSVSTWYKTIEKPFFNPPSWVFSPVWTILFIMMGVALYLVWKKGLKEKKVKIAFGIFWVQLVLNVLWSVFFFGLQSPLYALVDIVFLWFAIFITIVWFSRVSKKATYLLIPYLLWVSFAAVLNFAIFYLNI